MTGFYLAVCSDRFYVFDMESGERQSFEGNPFFEYDPDKIVPAIDSLVKTLVENNNLSDSHDLKFTIIESADGVKNDVVASKLGSMVSRRCPIGGIIRKALEETAKDPKNHAELGINYDGRCYRPEKNSAAGTGDFSLLALTVDPGALLKYAG